MVEESRRNRPNIGLRQARDSCYHPLWMAVLVSLHWLVHPTKDGFVLVSLVATIVFNLIAAGLFGRWLALIGFGRTAQLAGMALYLFSPWTANLTLTGIETPLYLACLFAFLIQLYLMLAPGGPTWRRTVWFGVTAGLLMLARTDAIFFTVPAFLLILATRPRTIGSLLASGVIASALLTPWLAWNLHAFGTIQQSSATALSGRVHFELPPMWQPAYWREAAALFQERLTWLVVGPLWRHSQHGTEGFRGVTFVGIALLAAAAAMVGVRAARRGVIAPLAFAVPVIALVSYYAGVRIFVQMWHFSTLPLLAIVIALNFIPATATPRAVWIATACLAPFCAYTLTNGYFYPQSLAIGSIDALRAHMADVPSFRSCSTDAGLFGHFSAHEVINIDGVVNNRAADYIRDGHLSDYIALKHCDEVLADRDQFRYYDRNLAHPGS